MEDTPSDLGPLLWSKLSGSKRSALTLKMCSSLSPSYQKRDKMKLIEKDPTNRRGSLSSWPCFFFSFCGSHTESQPPESWTVFFFVLGFRFHAAESLTLQSRKEKNIPKKKKEKKLASYAAQRPKSTNLVAWRLEWINSSVGHMLVMSLRGNK